MYGYLPETFQVISFLPFFSHVFKFGFIFLYGWNILDTQDHIYRFSYGARNFNVMGLDFFVVVWVLVWAWVVISIWVQVSIVILNMMVLLRHFIIHPYASNQFLIATICSIIQRHNLKFWDNIFKLGCFSIFVYMLHANS